MIISIINQKGDVSKITITQNIGSALTKLGKKVL
jgi:cellulose biosynthesis protein BcsQ